MLKENCKVGMKVTTTEKPDSGRSRSESETCQEEERVGCLIVKALNSNTALIGTINKQWHTRFNYNQIHPYWSDNNE